MMGSRRQPWDHAVRMNENEQAECMERTSKQTLYKEEENKGRRRER